MYTFAFHLNLTKDFKYSLIVAKLSLKTKAFLEYYLRLKS